MMPLLAVVLLVVASLVSGCEKKEAASEPAPTKTSESAGNAGKAKASAEASAEAPIKESKPKADPPEVVAKNYLELGAKGDLTKVKDLVDPKCTATKVGEVDAVRMMGARMTLSEATTKVESEEGDGAKVSYTVKGSVEAKEGQTETDILGKKVAIKVSALSMTGVTQSGTLRLKRIDGRWVVTCE